MDSDVMLIGKLKDAVRVKTDASSEEVEDLIAACLADLRRAGVYVKDNKDPLCLQAIKLYVKGHYGYDTDTEKFRDCYEALRNSMALCSDYAKEE